MLNQIEGAGLGLRTPHYSYIEENHPPVNWFEVLADNYLDRDGLAPYHLEKIRQDYPVVFHCVSLNLGSTDPLDLSHIKKLQSLSDRIEPTWISDHLCWTGVNGNAHHDLLPLPYTEESLKHVAERIKRVQETLGQRILIENVSSYVEFQHSVMSEWDFYTSVAELADCELLFDINNVYVSAHNHGFDANEYLEAIPMERVRQIHLAGHRNEDEFIIDDHGAPIIEPVFALYQSFLKKAGPIPTLIERDKGIPSFPELFDEYQKVQAIIEGTAAPTRRPQEVSYAPNP